MCCVDFCWFATWISVGVDLVVVLVVGLVGLGDWFVDFVFSFSS